MNKVADFRNFHIQRTFAKKYKNYSSYKPGLSKDFNHRCGYCNLRDKDITTFFEVDHFIPSKVCSEYHRSDLITDYANLVYSCKKCNLSKSSKYLGSLVSSDLCNEMFYDPAITPFQGIFFRNCLGGIDSDDEKGRRMIIELGLYRVSHNLAWILEELESICANLDKRIFEETNPNKKQLLLEASNILLKETSKVKNFMIANYNSF